MRTRRLLAVLACLIGLAVPFAPGTPAGAHHCEFPTRQYVVTAETLTLRSEPFGGGYVKATLYRGDLFNSTYAPDTTWIGGNAYRGGSKAYVGNGFVLRGYLSYNGNHWC